MWWGCVHVFLFFFYFLKKIKEERKHELTKSKGQDNKYVDENDLWTH